MSEEVRLNRILLEPDHVPPSADGGGTLHILSDLGRSAVCLSTWQRWECCDPI